MNLPNKITVLRIIMVFIFLAICNVDDLMANSPELQYHWRVIGFFFFLLASLTDLLDGYIARKYNMVTDFGKLMDPLADKIFMTTAFIMLVDKQILPGWIAVMILSREFLVTGLRLLAANKGQVISADTSGKIKTVAQMIFIGFGGSMWVGWIDKSYSHDPLWIIFYSSVTLITVYSGIAYFVRHRSLLSEAA